MADELRPTNDDFNVSTAYKPKYRIRTLADDLPILWGVYRIFGEPRCVIWAGDNNAANTIIVASAGADGERDAVAWANAIYDMNATAQNENSVFNAVEWLTNLPGTFSPLSPAGFTLAPERALYDEVYDEAQRL